MKPRRKIKRRKVIRSFHEVAANNTVEEYMEKKYNRKIKRRKVIRSFHEVAANNALEEYMEKKHNRKIKFGENGEKIIPVFLPYEIYFSLKMLCIDKKKTGPDAIIKLVEMGLKRYGYLPKTKRKIKRRR